MKLFGSTVAKLEGEQWMNGFSVCHVCCTSDMLPSIHSILTLPDVPDARTTHE